MEIKNIIFDFGGVIYDIDSEKCTEAFQNLGITQTDLPFTDPSVKALFDNLETGKVSPEYFYHQIRRITGSQLTDLQIQEAWNALLIGFEKERIRLLEKVREHYQIFLLSNSNFIHYQRYRKELEQQFGYTTFDNLFHQAYFSHEIFMQKPHKKIFEAILQEQKLVPGETLFIDDTKEHVDSAGQLEIRGRFLNLRNGEDLLSLFDQRGMLNDKELHGISLKS